VRPALWPLLLAAACENTEDWQLVFDDAQVPLAELVRQPAVTPADADAAQGDDPLLDLRTAKQRPEGHRGGLGRHFTTLRPYVPATPNGEEAEVQSTTLFVVAGNSGAPYVRRHGTRESVPATAPYGDGLLAVVCDPAAPPAVHAWDGASSVFVGDVVDPFAAWAELGVCEGEVRLGVSAPGTFLVATAGGVHRVTEAPFAVERVGDAPGDLAELVWLDDTQGALEQVGVAGGARFSWTDGSEVAAATLPGEAVGDPVWRGLDGALRLATTDGVWAWSPPAEPTSVQDTPSPPVDAGWEVLGPALVARETTPNEREPSLVVPVATAVALATDAGWVATEVPTTPCVDDARCRDHGESELIGVAGGADAPVLVYDVWRWSVDEAHETWCTPR
jgi:hypothetical protein